MVVYPSKLHAIIIMHERGFIEDFQLFGDNLLWVQGKIFIRPNEFIITEHHMFRSACAKTLDDVVFGVVIVSSQVKGILLNHYSCYTSVTPMVIRRKLQEMYLEYSQ